MRLIACLLFLSSVVTSVKGQYITGSSSVVIGQTASYTFNNGTLYPGYHWTMGGYGTISSQTQNGTSYTVAITWNSPGTASLTFLDNSYVGKGNLSVTISVGTPNTTFSTSGCGSTTIVRNSSPPTGVNWYWQTTSSGTSTSNSTSSYTVSTAGTYYLRAQWTATSVWSVSSQSTGSITITATPAVPATSTDGHRISNAAIAVPVSVSTVSGATGYAWYTVSTGGTAISGQTTTSYSPTLSTTQPYYVASANGTCQSATRKLVTANVYPEPVLTSTYGGVITMGRNVTLSASNFTYDLPYQWLDAQGNPISGATASTYSTNVAGKYYLRVTKATSLPNQNSNYTLVSGADGQQANYIISNTVLVDNILSEASVNSLDVVSNSQAVQYFDGLGRPLQTVVTQGSPNKKDIVVPNVYDGYGREFRKFLPYAEPTEDNGRLKTSVTDPTGYIGNGASFYAISSNNKVADDLRPFGETVYEDTPFGSPSQDFLPGKAWYDANKYVKHATLVNVDGTTTVTEKIINWTVDATGMPVRDLTANSGYYASGALSINSTKDENGNEVRMYTNLLGQMVLKKMFASTTGSQSDIGTDANWAQTYYIYDDLGLLRFVLQPELSKTLVSPSTTNPLQTSLDKFAFQYKYDVRKRMVQKQVPGALNPSYIVYDARNRVVLTQDANQRTTNLWVFIKYDVLNRPVMTGQLTSTNTLSQMQTAVDSYYTTNPNNFGETSGSIVHNYTNNSYPQVSDPTAYLSVTYYDDYSVAATWGTAYNYVNDGLTSGGYTQLLTTDINVNLLSKPTCNKVKVLTAANTWLKSVIYYDGKYRVVQTIGDNYKGAIDRTSNLYDFAGRILQSKTYHDGGGTNQVNVLKKIVYDHASRPSQIYQNINAAASDQLAVQYEYNELGQIVDKKLHNTTGTNFLQSVDYRYHLRGWLLSINNSQLANDGITNDETNDYFGLEMLYEKTETGLNDQVGDKVNFNGNISMMKWKNAGVAAGVKDQRSYKFLYDNMNRLTTATFQANDGSAWSKEVNTLNETINYNMNGSILTLQRNQNQRGLSGTTITSASQLIDNLTYTYADGNRLTKVEDAIANTVGTNDFKNGTNVTTEYTYDNAGSLTADQNKGIGAITYNVLGKALQVNFTDGRVVAYTYDGGGNKLTMAATVSGVTTTTEYVSGFVYVNTALSFFASPEGRVVKNGSSYEYQYSITDHLGNTRVLFTSVTPTASAPQATFEGDGSDYSGQYLNVSNVVSYTAAAHSGTKVVRMNQSYAAGPSYSKAVFAGDQVAMEVWSYYESASGFGSTNNSTVNMVGLIATAFGGVNGGAGDAGAKYSGVNSAISNFGLGSNPGDTQPSAFLNYILFDRNYKVMDMGWQRVPAGSFSKQQVTIPTVTVKEAGFIFVYLSYEDLSNNYVYFDDFKVTHTPTNIIQSNEYYPFGLQTANSWTRDTATPNNYLYNSASELNVTTGWYDLPFRNYDPALGMFLQVDPLADKSRRWSTYAFASNNPMRNIDPDGLSPDDILYGSDAQAAFVQIQMQHTMKKFTDTMHAEQGDMHVDAINPLAQGSEEKNEEQSADASTSENLQDPNAEPDGGDGGAKGAPSQAGDATYREPYPGYKWINNKYGKDFYYKYSWLFNIYPPHDPENREANFELAVNHVRIRIRDQNYDLKASGRPKINDLIPVFFSVQMGGTVYSEIVNPIDPMLPIWGNPGQLTKNVNPGFANPNATTPVSIQLDYGSTINVWIYFQTKH